MVTSSLLVMALQLQYALGSIQRNSDFYEFNLIFIVLVQILDTTKYYDFF